jgi:hypothetical protein
MVNNEFVIRSTAVLIFSNTPLPPSTTHTLRVFPIHPF